MNSPNSFHGVSTQFSTPIQFHGNTFVIQYEVKSIKSHITCSGAYIKLFGPNYFDQNRMSNETNYVIMFGPDQCGETNKVHFILNHWNPIHKKFEEKQLIDGPVAGLSTSSQIFTLIIKNTNQIEIRINGSPKFFGSFNSDFQPPINPPHEIEDPTDTQPSDWVEDEYIFDESVKKPDDWDETEPEFIPDPNKLNPPEGWLFDEPDLIIDPDDKKPDEWDESIFGEWEPRQISNPKCKQSPGCGKYQPPLIVNPKYVGPWEQPMQRNPDFKGKWRRRKILNPEFFEDKEIFNFAPLTGLGFDLWTVDAGIQFTNIIISDDVESVDEFNHEVYPQFFQKKEIKKTEIDFKLPEKFFKNENSKEIKSENSDFEIVKQTLLVNYQRNPILTISMSLFVIVVPIFLAVFVC